MISPTTKSEGNDLVLVRSRARIKLRIRIRVRVGVKFNVSVYRWSNCRRSKCTFSPNLTKPRLVHLLSSHLKRM